VPIFAQMTESIATVASPHAFTLASFNPVVTNLLVGALPRLFEVARFQRRGKGCQPVQQGFIRFVQGHVATYVSTRPRLSRRRLA